MEMPPIKPFWSKGKATTSLASVVLFTVAAAHSVDPDQPFRPIAITDSGDPDHAVHYA